MPELPEVELLRSHFEKRILNRTILHCEYLDEEDVVLRSSKQLIGRSLLHQEFTEVQRIGKHLFARIRNEKWLHLHFGMTGSLKIYKKGEPVPDYTRFAIHFDDGIRMAYTDQRKFGIIQIVDTPGKFREENHLGQDLLTISAKDFISSLEGRKTAVKKALLDQAHFAGIGNWMADEILFREGIHPETACRKLSKDQMRSLHKTAVKISREAVKSKEKGNFIPRDFFMHYRKEGARHPDHPRSAVKKITVNGRGTYIVPAKQKNPNDFGKSYYILRL